MKIGLLKIGEIDEKILIYLCEKLAKIFVDAECEVIPIAMNVPESSFNPNRSQYYSSRILADMKRVTDNQAYTRVLGVVDVDLYVPHLNFIFGEAELLGKFALISLYRLKSEFYGDAPNEKLFLKRALKEAVHELGHTFGLEHCKNFSCVMFFSNSIIDTDRKNAFFCEKCLEKVRLKSFE